MNPPRSVSIIGQRFDIRAQTELSDCGRCDYHKTTILFDPGQSAEALRDTVLHEIVHAIAHLMDMKLSESKTLRIATGLLCVLRENPSLVKFLTDD